MDIRLTFTTPGTLFLLTMGFGFWLSHLGKPYNSILFNIHKLIALGTVIIATTELAKIITTANSRSFLIIFLALAAICIMALFASGALMSTGKLDYALMLTIHRIAPVGLTIALGMAVYLLGVSV